jgi:hypothetical protein
MKRAAARNFASIPRPDPDGIPCTIHSLAVAGPS